MPQLLAKPLAWLKPDPKQPRKHFDEEDLRQLGESLRKKQLQPILSQPDGTIIAGERRYRAALLAGLPTLEVKVADEPLSECQVRGWQLVENMQRADLSGYEQWTACAELMCMNPSWQMKDLAEHLNLSQATVTRTLCPSKITQEWQDALRDGKVTISDCYTASRLEKSKQGGLLALKLSGANREAMEEAGRKARTPRADVVRAARVVCPLSTGVRVTVQGPEMDLEALIEALQSALEAARKANKESLDVKTWARVMTDRAKAV